MGEIKNYKDLIVWQKAMLLVEKIYMSTRKFPKEEMYGIVSQLQRAAVSVPSNIAEGRARNSRKEFMHFLGIAKGSLAEIETLCVLSSKLGFIEKQLLENILLDSNEVSKLLGGLLRALSKNTTSPPIPNT